MMTVTGFDSSKEYNFHTVVFQVLVPRPCRGRHSQQHDGDGTEVYQARSCDPPPDRAGQGLA